jgi:hypothetical protein
MRMQGKSKLDQLKRLRVIIFAGGLLYLVLAPLTLIVWERNWMTAVFVYGGMILLVLSCAIYFYGFLFWKDK